MSCYLIDRDTAITLAAWALKEDHRPVRVEACIETATAIWQTNAQSVCARYEGAEIVVGIRGKNNATRYPDMLHWGPDHLSDLRSGLIHAALDQRPGVVWYASREAVYQCGEFDGWDQTPGGKAIELAGANAAGRMAAKTGVERGWPRIELAASRMANTVSLSELARR